MPLVPETHQGMVAGKGIAQVTITSYYAKRSRHFTQLPTVLSEHHIFLDDIVVHCL